MTKASSYYHNNDELDAILKHNHVDAILKHHELPCNVIMMN